MGEIEGCPICGRKSQYRKLVNRNNHVLYRCSYCWGDFAKATTALDYGTEMYVATGDEIRDSYKLDSLKTPETHLAEPVRWYFRSLAANYLATSIPNGGKLLDVGCGVGTFSKMAANLGLDVYAFDPAAGAIKYAREQFGLKNTQVGTIQDLPENWRDFDVVSVLEVIEHVVDPRQMGERIFDLIKPGGHIVMSVPNRDRVSVRLWGNPEWDRPPHHMTQWSKRVLYFFLTDLGFTNVRIRDDDLTRKSLAAFLPKYLNKLMVESQQNNGIEQSAGIGKVGASNLLRFCVRKTGDAAIVGLKNIAGDFCNQYLANSLIAVGRKPA